MKAGLDRLGPFAPTNLVSALALPLILTSICLASTMLTQSLTVTMILLSLALVGNYAFKGPFWALAGDWLSARMAAVGLAATNTWAHIGTARSDSAPRRD